MQNARHCHRIRRLVSSVVEDNVLIRETSVMGRRQGDILRRTFGMR